MNAYAVAGFVVSIASFLCPFFGLTGIAGLALSAIGFSTARLEKSRTGLPMAGLILSIVSIVFACAENIFLVLLLLGKVSV